MDRMQLTAGPQTLRADWTRDLQNRLTQGLGKPGSQIHERLTKLWNDALDGDGRVDLSKIEESARKELVKLQNSAAGFESIFVERLLQQMRQSMGATGDDPMRQFAEEHFDRAVAESVSRSDRSLGIGRMIFLDTAENLVRQRIGEAAAVSLGARPQPTSSENSSHG